MEILIIVLVVLEILLLAVAFRIWFFNKSLKNELKLIVAEAEKRPKHKYSPDLLKGIPPAMQRYFRYCLTPGQKVPAIAVVSQSGYIRTGENSRWLPFNSVQYFDARSPAFTWIARVNPAFGSWVSARDLYYQGQGSMIIRMWSFLPIGSSRGKEIGVSSLIRYVSELVFCPTAFIYSDMIRWEELGPDRVRASVNDGFYKARVDFDVNEKGQLIQSRTEDRFRQKGQKLYRQEWVGKYSNYQQFKGMKIPTELEAEWRENGKVFSYIKINLDAIKFG